MEASGVLETHFLLCLRNLTGIPMKERVGALQGIPETHSRSK